MIKLAKIYDSGVVKNLEERTELILNKMNVIILIIIIILVRHARSK